MVVRDKLRSDGFEPKATARGFDQTLVMAVFSPAQLIASVPPLTRFFTLTTVLFSLFYLYLQWKSEITYPLPYLTLVPGTSLFYPWTFFTSVFVEITVYEVCFHPLSHSNHSCDAIF